MGIEEASHPEDIGSPFKYPHRKLRVSLQEFGEPEAQGGGVPGHPFPDLRYASIVHVVQGIPQVLKKIKLETEKKENPPKAEMTTELTTAHLTHNDRSFNGQF